VCVQLAEVDDQVDAGVSIVPAAAGWRWGLHR